MLVTAATSRSSAPQERFHIDGHVGDSMDTVILIDEPIWPAHGTVWAHLVSDTSLDELHAFAEANGIPRRGFDHRPLRRAGAQAGMTWSRWAPIRSGLREFVERLNASGLRVPQKYKRHRH